MPSRPTRTNTSRHDEDDHLRLLCQEATGPDGVRRVLELLARRFTGEVVLAGPGKGQAVAVPSDTGRLLHLVGGELAEDVARGRAGHLDAADATVREAVPHLLMVGDVSGARRTAAVPRPELPDLARVHVIENAPVGGDGRHPAPAPATRLIRELVEAVPGTRMGIGLPMALRDIPIGYKQAFHALSVARHRSERYARFSPRGELGELLGHAGRAWAASTLAPLPAYRPARPRDPDAFELLATLLSWLEFGARAASQLKIHRNTLSSRLHRVGAEPDRDLTRFAVQAELHLALQLIDERPHPGAAAGAIGVDELFDRPEVRRWAETLLSPLPDATRRTLPTTVRTWFRHDLGTTAAAELGISAHGLRKRLARVEELLGRALPVGPSARYDLHHALRVHVEPARA